MTMFMCCRRARCSGRGAEVIVQTASVKTGESTRASGTLAEWQHNIARLAVGNSRVAFGISTAFAGPLLDIVNEKSGGFNAGGSRKSVRPTGSPRQPPRCVARPTVGVSSTSWNATQNGLEIICAETCDLTLVLDELGQAEKKTLESTIYQIFNESGKRRMVRTADLHVRNTVGVCSCSRPARRRVEQHLAVATISSRRSAST